MLVEQAGPWGADAVLGSRLPRIAAKELKAACRRVGARALLIRRHGRYVQEGATVYVGSSAERGSWLESFSLETASDMLDIDLQPLRRGEGVGGRPVRDPLYLVCTNGSHDACCAEYGRPLASALDTAVGEQAWECSHIGGDRFAGNLLCFPHGLYYGRAEPEDGVRIAARYADGLLALERFRGRSAYPFIVQAGEFFVRRETGLDGVEDLRLAGAHQLAQDVTLVTFLTDAGSQLSATVRVSHADEADRLTCSAAVAVRAPRYELVSFTAEGI